MGTENVQNHQLGLSVSQDKSGLYALDVFDVGLAHLGDSVVFLESQEAEETEFQGISEAHSGELVLGLSQAFVDLIFENQIELIVVLLSAEVVSLRNESAEVSLEPLFQICKFQNS